MSGLQVRLEVNGNEAPFFMKVGETGEAFFVFETAGDVPDDMQTSPLAGPVSDDEVAETPIDVSMTRLFALKFC